MRDDERLQQMHGSRKVAPGTCSAASAVRCTDVPTVLTMQWSCAMYRSGDPASTGALHRAQNAQRSTHFCLGTTRKCGQVLQVQQVRLTEAALLAVLLTVSQAPQARPSPA